MNDQEDQLIREATGQDKDFVETEPEEPNDSNETSNESSPTRQEARTIGYVGLALADAARNAADWLSRSTRIDDREQGEDLREAIAQFYASTK